MFERLRVHWLTIDARSVGLFRAAIGIVLLLHFAERWSLSGDFYGAAAVLPASSISESREIPRFPTALTVIEQYPGGMTVFFAVTLCEFAALAVGLYTRWAAFISLVAFSSLAHRNPYVLIGGDYVLGSMLLWMQVLPIADRFSLDALIRRRAGRTLPDAGSSHPTRTSVAAFGVLLQIGLIYLASAWQKTGSTWWQDGTALSHVLGMERYIRPGADLLERLPESSLVLMTRGVLVFEYVVLPLILLPVARPWLRRVALFGLAALHLGIAAVLDTGIFSITMLGCLPLLLSKEDWDWATRIVGHTAAHVTESRDATLASVGRWTSGRIIATELAGMWLLLGMIAANYNINFAVANRDVSLTPLDLPQRFAAAYQRWDMFTPDAPKCDPQVVVRIRLLDGRLLELPGVNESSAIGMSLAKRIRSFPWRIYFLHAILQHDPKRQAEIESLRVELSRFISREMAAAGRPSRDVFTIELWARSVPTRSIPGQRSFTGEPYWLSSLDLAAERRERLARR